LRNLLIPFGFGFCPDVPTLTTNSDALSVIAVGLAATGDPA